MIGTILIAVPGYGIALWGALGMLLCVIDCARFASNAARRREEARGAIRGAIMALAFAGVTRWLLGVAL